MPDSRGRGDGPESRDDDSGYGEDIGAAKWTGTFVFHPARILLVDDARSHCRAMAYAFESAGFESFAVWTRDDARRLIKRQPFDCAVIDWQLTGWGRDGIGLAAELKDPWPRTPVVLVSGYTKQYVESRLDPTEVDVFCPKEPFADVLQTATQFVQDYRDRVVWAAVEEALARLDAPARRLDDRVRNVISRVCIDLTSDWHVPELCEAAGRVPKRDLRGVFRSELHLRPRDFVKMIRVATAKRIIQRGGLKQDAIATMVGFRNAQRMNEAFNELEGQPPGAFGTRSSED